MLNQTIFSPQRQKLIVYIALIVVTLAVYWQVNHYDFVNFDDNTYVTENSYVQSGITMDGFRWAFSIQKGELWYPLLWISFMLDNQLYGMNAGGYHVTNLILHILSSLLLFWLFNRMTGETWKSAFVAALFALHPMHVESVAWISERKDVLSAFFWILTLCLYVYYTEKPVIKRYSLVLLSFVLALMSKPMVISLPLILILLDYWPLKRFELRKGGRNLILWQLREKIPFFALSAVLAAIMVYTQQTPPEVELFPLGTRIENALISFVTYLGKTFWPHNLAVFYPFPSEIPLWQVIGATFLIFVISTAVIIMMKRLPYLFVGWMWYTITIIPVIGWIGIIKIWLYSMTDRYHYLPSIGIAVMMAWGIPLLFPRKDMRKIILFPAAIVFLIIMSFLAWQQCGYWKNSATLFSHALQVTKDNDVARIQLGLALFAEGKTQEAIEHYNKAILMKSRYADIYAYNSRGAAYARLGQYQRAIEDFNTDISINFNSNHFKTYNNRGVVYAKLGQYQRAIEDFNKASSLNPAYANTYNNRAFVYLNMGNMESGCNDARRACALGACATLDAAKGQGYCR